MHTRGCKGESATQARSSSPHQGLDSSEEGHKSYECKVKNGGGAKKKEKKQTSKLSNTYTNKVNKKASTPYLLKKKKNDKVVAIKVNKQANNGVKRFWVP